MSDDIGFDDDFTSAGATTVESFMSDEVVICDNNCTLRNAARLLDEAGVGMLVVGSRAEVEGVVSERDILRAVAQNADLDASAVTEIESRTLKWATPTSTVDDVIEEMMEGYIRHVLVAGDDGELVGIVSMRDLLTAVFD